MHRAEQPGQPAEQVMPVGPVRADHRSVRQVGVGVQWPSREQFLDEEPVVALYELAQWPGRHAEREQVAQHPRLVPEQVPDVPVVRVDPDVRPGLLDQYLDSGTQVPGPVDATLVRLPDRARDRVPAADQDLGRSGRVDRPPRPCRPDRPR
ncbi:hypothetical protein GCM10027615_41480 [Plantactinospora veratri]